MRLFLAAMLQQQPVVTCAIVSSLNGSRWVDVYSPLYGMEFRLFTADMGVPFKWDHNNKCECFLLENLHSSVCATVAGTPGGDIHPL